MLPTVIIYLISNHAKVSQKKEEVAEAKLSRKLDFEEY